MVTSMWGFKKDDFNCVKITLLKPSTQEYQGYRNFQTVKFTKYNSNTVINAAVSVVTKDPPQSASDSLESLFTELEQLKGLVALKKAGRGKKRTTSLWEVTETATMTKLCSSLVQSFMSNMAYTNGKWGVCELVRAVIEKCSLEMQVVYTGSTSHPSNFSTVVKIRKKMESSSESSSEDSTSSEEYHSSKLFAAGDITPEPRKTKQSPSFQAAVTTDSSPEDDSKVKTPDILVFENMSVNCLAKPLTTKLLISVKSGFHNKLEDFAIELLGRLPYQSGPIFGLQVNAAGAFLASVAYDPEEVKVIISDYRSFIFLSGEGRPLNVSGLKSMVECIKCVLTDEALNWTTSDSN
ncbi:uncharacterized protein LOC117297841 isoform X2 [Asterias rubens]|uniref:uncharacterized protein LOC117297841 isoform X2 n=1 Tax=Asterias rubens TaxID=7604 RepID=UPI001455ABF3|nr:uncharacterized protein LOC117297841 isoform X2 [Asterias rubens]